MAFQQLQYQIVFKVSTPFLASTLKSLGNPLVFESPYYSEINKPTTKGNPILEDMFKSVCWSSNRKERPTCHWQHFTLQLLPVHHCNESI